MALESKGTAYIVVRYRDNKIPKDCLGAYQLPRSGINYINMWIVAEFPALQRNPHMNSVVSIDGSDNWKQIEDWNRAMGLGKTLDWIELD